jgi:signal transduction histidine kinase
VTVDAPADLPRVWADHDRIEQVIVNIVDNAFRHGAHDRPVAVTIRAMIDAGCLHLEIADNGRGLTAEFADVIFQPYVRADGAGPGAGLGLTIARGIVEAHGGRVWADVSEAGEGARVHVVLPVEPEDRTHA